MELPDAFGVDGFELRRMDEDDVADLVVHFSNPSVLEFLDIEPTVRAEDGLRIVRWSQRIHAAASGIRWVVRDAGGGFVGTCGFNQIVRERASLGEIAYDLAPAFWGRGVMARIVPVLVEQGFSRLALERLEAWVTPGNERSRALLLRHGFRLEGTLRHRLHARGRHWDQEVYARLRGDPAPEGDVRS